MRVSCATRRRSRRTHPPLRGTFSGGEGTAPATIPHGLVVRHVNLSATYRETADRLGSRVAIRHKRHGLYRDLSWAEVRRAADLVASGLMALGVRPGDRVAILSENRVEWIVADLAIVTAGAVGMPMHSPLTPNQVAYQLAHSGAVGVFVSGPCQAAKVAEVLEELPDLRFLVAFDPTPRVAERLPQRSWPGLKHLGVRSHAAMAIRECELALKRDDLATIIYTSGTTGPPKGVMLTHGNLLSNAEAAVEIAGAANDDVVLSWLPFSHIYARTCDVVVSSIAGATIALAESIDTLVANLAEIRPTRMSAVPRFYEKVWSNVQGLPAGPRSAALRGIFGPRIRHLSSGGAPLPKHVAFGFHDAGLTLMEGYGLTETSPIISFNSHEAFRVGSVGHAAPGVEIRIAEDGEILTKGPHVMRGYWRDEEATARAIVDGWFHTGDLGAIDADGFLAITGRKKDLIITSGGKNVAPSEIERLLVADPLIEQAVACGDGKPFISALIVPDLAKLSEAIGRDVEIEGHLVVCEPSRSLLRERIDRAMQAVSGPERVKEFLVLARPFRVEDDEMTATLKVRRGFILAKHAAAIEAIYAGNP